MPRPPPDPVKVRAALERAASGQSAPEIARALHVSARTVLNWVERYGEPAAPEPPPLAPPEAPPAEPEDEDEPDDGASSLERMRRMMRDLQRDARVARKRGNLRDAQRILRDSVALSATIARLEKAQQADGGAVHASRADIEAALQRHRENVRQLCERPLLCAHCGRELSIKWGQGK